MVSHAPRRKTGVSLRRQLASSEAVPPEVCPQTIVLVRHKRDGYRFGGIDIPLLIHDVFIPVNRFDSCQEQVVAGQRDYVGDRAFQIDRAFGDNG